MWQERKMKGGGKFSAIVCCRSNSGIKTAVSVIDYYIQFMIDDD